MHKGIEALSQDHGSSFSLLGIRSLNLLFFLPLSILAFPNNLLIWTFIWHPSYPHHSPHSVPPASLDLSQALLYRALDAGLPHASGQPWLGNLANATSPRACVRLPVGTGGFGSWLVYEDQWLRAFNDKETLHDTSTSISEVSFKEAVKSGVSSEVEESNKFIEQVGAKVNDNSDEVIKESTQMEASKKKWKEGALELLMK
ncbi:hypothetical protein ACH5RR_003444 [Cinchona calisaya]|uniref:Uncharacterized protein n=1 Tax=Cinchona calisaya TaxID=153742 RepID=A0ABD3AUV0_9GENT